MIIFETLSKFSNEQWKHSDQEMKPASYIFLDDNNQIKETKLSELLDSAASVYINRTIYNPAKLIHDSIFGT